MHERSVVRSGWLPILLTSVAVLAAGPALASKKTAKKVFFGFNASSDSTDYKAENLFTGSVEDNLGFSLTAAFPILPYLAAEVGYAKIGDADFNGTWNDPPDVGSDVGTIKADGFRYGFVGALPLGRRVALLGRLGAFSWSVDENEVFNGVPESFSASGTDLMFGAGVQVMATKKLLDVRAEWTRYLGVGELDQGTGSGDTDSFSVGLIFRMRGPYFGMKNKNIER